MLTADYLIANYDRHYNNFGAIRNADTLEWMLIKEFSWLNLADLSGIDEEVSEILIKAHHIDEKRRDAICFGLCLRAERLTVLTTEREKTS